MRFGATNEHGTLNLYGAVNAPGAVTVGGPLTISGNGLILPNMTKAARNSLAGVTVGSIVYQTDNNPGLRYFDGTNWNKFIPFNDP
jgi:hypothetical protein